MPFEWDAGKSARNLELRGFDFAFASQVFTGTYVEFDDTRRDYGERRVLALPRGRHSIYGHIHRSRRP